MLEEIDRVRWIPAWGRERIRGMMESRPDWCISRQRNWGVPIVAFFCAGCGETSATRLIADHVAELFEREGADAWFERSAKELLPPGLAARKCGSREFRKEQDILDVWFDSGVSHAAVLEQRAELRSPADLYLEGSDQHRGWFHTSLLTSVATRGRAPYEAVLTHGFTVDAEGRKMSKSAGTGLSPQDIVESHGAEILRLWVAAEDYRDDVGSRKEIVGRLIESFRRIRNTARFLIAQPLRLRSCARRGRDRDTLLELDRWILARTRALVERCRSAYFDYEFHVVYHALNNFCSVDLSALYLDIVKDRLYCSRADGAARRSAQTALWQILDVLVRLMAPILSFTAEEIWGYVPATTAQARERLSRGFPVGRPRSRQTPPLARDLGAAAGGPRRRHQGARGCAAGGSHRPFARRPRAPLLRDGWGARHASRQSLGGACRHCSSFPKSSGRTISARDAESPIVPGLRIAIERAAGQKCARCWNYRTSVGTDARHPTICAPCVSALAHVG